MKAINSNIVENKEESSITISNTNQVILTEYEIESWSSYSENYYPENLLCYDHVSLMTRWCVDINSQNGYIILRLREPLIPRSITFIRTSCHKLGSLKQFAIFGSYDKKDWFQLFNGHSDYTNLKEEVLFQLSPQNFPLPVKYLKMILLSCWSYPTNVSVWPFYISCYNNPSLVKQLLQKYNKSKSILALQESMTKLRTLDNQAYYFALKTSIPSSKLLFVDKLYQVLVIDCNFKEASKIIEQFYSTEAFATYYKNIEHKLEWKLLQPNGSFQPNGNIQPKMRGGHQMCIDPIEQVIYMYGGWDGDVDINDFWIYHIPTNNWQLLSSNAYIEGGPTARSCHQICMDRKRKYIYVLGRFKEYGVNENLKNEFFVYDITHKKWTNLSDTSLYRYGPPLCFSHQMVYCETLDIIFVFGGNILNEKHYSTKCGKLFSYDIKTKQWNSGYYHHENSNQIEIEPRSDHSMHIDENLLRLYITGGNRGANTINEFCYIDIATGDVHHIDDISAENTHSNPDYCYAMKSTYDCEHNELYMFSGLERYKKNQNNSPSCNSVYVYEMKKNKWSCIYENKHTGYEYWSRNCDVYPLPRFAFQVVYDDINKINYMFGGNPGKYSISYTRLNDMWSCKIVKPTKHDVFNQMKQILASEQVYLWAVENPIKACLQLREKLNPHEYFINDNDELLQNLMYRIIDQYDPCEEYFKFDKTSFHFTNNGNNNVDDKPSHLLNKQQQCFQNVFENLVPFFKYEQSIDTTIITT